MLFNFINRTFHSLLWITVYHHLKIKLAYIDMLSVVRWQISATAFSFYPCISNKWNIRWSSSLQSRFLYISLIQNRKVKVASVRWYSTFFSQLRLKFFWLSIRKTRTCSTGCDQLPDPAKPFLSSFVDFLCCSSTVRRSVTQTCRKCSSQSQVPRSILSPCYHSLCQCQMESQSFRWSQ